jgi:glycerol-3-phosphate acyltransferase PlsY
MSRTKRAGRLGLAAGLGYLLGTFPTADLVTRHLARRGGPTGDLRANGTGNPGALNAAKTLGAKWGAAVLAGDIFKASAASFLGRKVAGDDGAYVAGIGAVAGHCLPVWSGFRGGKGIAASAGTTIVSFPAYMPIDVALAGGTLVLSRGRAGLATYVASAVFTASSVVWWRKKLGNLWGPKASGWLPVYAAATSAVICYRFWAADSEARSAPALSLVDSSEVARVA